MNIAAASSLEERVLVLMPTARDGERTARLLREEVAVTCLICADMTELCRELRLGAGAVMLTDDVLLNDPSKQLMDVLREQPPWSAVPILLLAHEGASERLLFPDAGPMQNVQFLERPVRMRALFSAVLSALRARRSQYQIRDALLKHERQAAQLAAEEEKLRQSQAELARQAEQLRTADRLKDEFLATLAHELRNPLAPITAGLALLSESPEVDVTRTLGVIQRQVSHMVRLIDDLLDVSRITRGKLELKRERVALRSVIDAAIEASQSAIERAQHELRVRVSDQPLFLDADPTRIAQIISNLLNNSSKYMRPGGSIELSAKGEGDWAVITVTDRGAGIPAEHIEDVFEMFSQVDRALERSQGGLGIGLALVRRLAEMHGGTVTAFSPGADQGSTFTVRLPLASSEVAARKSSRSAEIRAPAGKRILVVDDNSDAAEMLAMMLERSGYATQVAQDGAEALRSLPELLPHAVILDIGLPDMNGYEVAQRMRKDPRFTDTVLIALTGWGTGEDKRKALASGFHTHMTKPVNADELRATLVRLLQNPLERAG